MSRTTASCHCGAVGLSFQVVGGLKDASRCDCSLCRRVKPGAVSAMTDDLQVTRGAEHLGLYQFGTKTARHYFCKICGTHTHHQRRMDPKEMGVNIGCLEGVDARSSDLAQWVEGVNHPADNP